MIKKKEEQREKKDYVDLNAHLLLADNKSPRTVMSLFDLYTHITNNKVQKLIIALGRCLSDRQY
jgi:hypothetical protein